MARWTNSGVEPKSLGSYIIDLERIFRDALGETLDVTGDSPAGQLIGLLGSSLSQVDEAIVGMSNAFSVSRASGEQLDSLVSILGVRRIVATRSTVTVIVRGRSGTTVPKGWRARTTLEAVFRSTAAVLITDGTASVVMESEQTGPVAATTGTLTQLVDLLPGIDSLSNAQDAALGRNAETDTELRRRYETVCTRQSAGTVDAIIAQVRSVAGVKAVLLRQNTSGSSQTIAGQAVPGHSIFVTVDGGDNAAVAAAIAASKPAAIGTAGGVSVSHQYGFQAGGGPTETIRFSRVTSVTVTGTVTGTLTSGFPSDGVLRIQKAAAAFINAVAIGTKPDLIRYQAAMANAAPGWAQTAYTLSAAGTDVKQSSYNPSGTDRYAMAEDGLTVNLS